MEGEISTKLHRQNYEKNGHRKEVKNGMEREMPQRRFTWGRSLKYHVDPEEVINKTADLPNSCTDSNIQGTPIQEFFSGGHVLITGATGFMGKILVEKLLVSCPKLEKLYLIIREKKGQSMEKRFDTLFKEPVFARLRKLVPDYRNKVVAISGDCSKIGLGLSEEDYRKLGKKVTVVIHGAATVRFDEKIRIATHINVRGVREILNFSRTCQNLKSIVHISTAYANSITEITRVEEKFYPAAYDYKKLIELVDKEEEDKLAEATPSLISPWPNTYAFTKQVAEDVIRREGTDLPLSIFRPAMVVASAKEPIRSWSDNIYGPTGVIVGAGTGVLRVMHAHPHIKANVVPVDMAVNGVIAAAWKAHKHFQSNKNSTLIYNYVSSYRNAVTWDEFAHWNGLYGRRWATVHCIWYPMLHIIRAKFLYTILSFLVHTLPAYIMDAALYATGNETKLVKGYRKIAKFCDVVAYFATRDWDFPDEHTAQLWEELSPADQAIYPFDPEGLDWDYYALTHLLGLRVHIVKDSMDTLPQARLKYKRLMVVHFVFLGVLGMMFLWCFAKLVGWSFF